MIEAGEPLIQEAIAALRQYHEAQAAGLAPDQAVTDYQLYALGHQPLTRH